MIEREQRELLNDIAFYLWDFGVATDREGVAATAREVLQETVATSLRILDKYDPSRPAGGWLRGIAVKVILHLLRTQSRERRRLTLVGDSEPIRRAVGGHKARELSEAEMFDLLSPPVGTLSARTPSGEELLALVGEDDREILWLRHFEGLDGKELAARLGTSEGAVYQRLSRARKHLRQALQGDNKSSGGKSNA
ncbi:MAG: sigma-70 family RNA polymerase sigma factor [Acidobacteria bacterium]|nr:sigma-70 family RNA polymerase sigma factor [Acidobacteriota bacterium]